MRYIFTVTAGRSGQASLADLISRHVPDACVALEEPMVRPCLPAPFVGWERRFRRRFLETDELLGRGRVLDAFAHGDDAYLVRIAQRRQRRIVQQVERSGKSVYVDVSKFFARGLHRGWERILPEFSLIRLARDPILMMRSFLNRRKPFTRDNNVPDAPQNILRLDRRGMDLGEYYLWSWCEMYLRFDDLVARNGVRCAVDIRSEDLSDSTRMHAAFVALGLPHTPLASARRVNTNVEIGLPETQPTHDDVARFKRFLARLPQEVRQRIRYFDTYDPAQLFVNADMPTVAA